MNNNEILNKIKELKSKITQLEEIAEKQNEPKFERKAFCERYYTVKFNSTGVDVGTWIEDLTGADTGFFNTNNYFHTSKRAREVVDKIKYLLKLERLYDTYCPDYKPNWNNKNKVKFSICFDHFDNKYCYSYAYSGEDMSKVYFPTEEIAQKVCDILNEELANKR